MLSFLLGLSFYAQAQVGKGFSVGGSLQTSFSTSTNSGTRMNGLTLGISPRLAYYFSERWAVGISGAIDYSATSTMTRSTNWSSGIFGRYAHPIGLDGRLMLWGELDAKFNAWEVWNKALGGNGYLIRGTGLSSSLSAGLLFFPRPKWGIEVGLGSLAAYNRPLSLDGNPITPTQSFSFLNIGNTSPQVGLYYFFNR